MMPYLELPIVGQSGACVYTGKFQPVSISAYQSVDNECSMIFIDGQPFHINMDIATLESYLTAYWTKVNTKQNVKQRLGLVQ